MSVAPVRRRLDLKTLTPGGGGPAFLLANLVDDSQGDHFIANGECTLPEPDALLGTTGLAGSRPPGARDRGAQAGADRPRQGCCAGAPCHPPAEAEPAAVSGWLDRLAQDDVPRWQGCPVALVDADGPRLLHWDGQALLPWAEALPPED